MTNANTMTNSNTMTDANTMTNSDSLGVSSSAIIGDLGDISSDVISMVVDMLDPAVRKVDGVVSLPSSCSIVRLLLVDPCSSQLVSHAVLVVVGGDLSKVIVTHRMGHTNSMSDSNSVSNSNSMSNANSVASEELGRSRCSNNEGRDGQNGL